MESLNREKAASAGGIAEDAAAAPAASPIELSLACGEHLRVHRFSVREAISSPFTVQLLARSPDPCLDLKAIAGQPAALRVASGYRFAHRGERLWSGLCHHARLVQAVDIRPGEVGLSTYEISIVPSLWLLTQRSDYRVFQHLSLPDIARTLLEGWAGAGFGMFALPRVGQEVLVAFLDGDPDQPIVIGRVSNALNPPPLKLPEEKTQSAWRSASSPGGGGFNEIRFEDRRDGELVSMHAARDLRARVEQDEGLAVGRHRTKTVGGDESARTEGRVVVYVGQDAHLTVEGELRERIGGTRSLIVEGSLHQQVGGAAALEAVGRARDRHRAHGRGAGGRRRDDRDGRAGWRGDRGRRAARWGGRCRDRRAGVPVSLADDPRRSVGPGRGRACEHELP